MAGGNKPVNIITLGRWSAAVFYDPMEDRYSTNIRRNLPKEEIEAKRAECHPESILLYEEEPLTIAQLCNMVSTWISEQKIKATWGTDDSP